MPIIKKAAVDAASGLVVLDEEFLRSEDLLDIATIGGNMEETVEGEVKALALAAAVPVRDRTNAIVGTLIGGELLNNNVVLVNLISQTFDADAAFYLDNLAISANASGDEIVEKTEIAEAEDTETVSDEGGAAENTDGIDTTVKQLVGKSTGGCVAQVLGEGRTFQELYEHGERHITAYRPLRL